MPVPRSYVITGYLKAHPQACVPYPTRQIFPTTFMEKF